MKALAKLLMPLAVAALMVTGAGAAGHFTFMGLEDYEKGVPSQVERSDDAAAISGTLTGLDHENREILVRTEVPGIFGPQEAETPFRINDDTTITICVKSLEECVSKPDGQTGWESLSSFEDRASLALAEKKVTIISDPDDPSRVVHVQIDYLV